LAIAFPLIYFLRIEPVNVVIEQATAGSVPTDWEQLRNQWGDPGTYAEVEHDYLSPTTNESTTRGYIALFENEPIGLIQSYIVMGSSDGWWEQEIDPGVRFMTFRKVAAGTKPCLGARADTAAPCFLVLG
jgi:hypothetical protein